MMQHETGVVDPKNDNDTATDRNNKNNNAQGSDVGGTVMEKQSREKTSIRLVIQRFRNARLLLNESEIVTVGSNNSSQDQQQSVGILVYASFAKSATKPRVMQAAKTIMNLPVLTRGLWGDGSEPMSALQMAESSVTTAFNNDDAAAASSSGGVAVMLVPQANLISKVKNQGKSIQYHQQIDKATGECLFDYLVDCIRSIALQRQCRVRGEDPPTWLVHFDKPATTTKDASLPLQELFRDTSLYSRWNEEGIPLTNVHGEPLTKSATKKLKKQYEAHKKRHEKYQKNVGTTTIATLAKNPKTAKNETLVSWSMLDDSFIRIVAGSFGKRQGLELHADMGPFCHVMDL